jgi:hypothetical protein
MSDLDFILGLGQEYADEGGPGRLLEVGRELSKGRAVRRLFLWSTGRIGASFAAGRVTLAREYGDVGDGSLALTLAEFRALDRACRDWERRRDSWAAFWESCAGYPIGYGAGRYFQRPGPRAREERIGRWCRDEGNTGYTFKGKDVRRPPAAPLPRGVGIDAEIWRLGEKFGKPKGERVGVVYRLGPGCRLEARRPEAMLFQGRRRIGLEPHDEERFVQELLAAVS